MEIPTPPMPNRWLRLAAIAWLATSAGCTSVISSAYLREAWLDAVEHAADAKSEAKLTNEDKATDRTGGETVSRDARGGEDSEDSVEASSDAESTPAAAATAWSPATLDEAVDEADRRLAHAGGLNAAARGTLIATLKSTPRQDWLVVVEEFTAALAAAHVDDVAGAIAAPEPVAPMPPADAPRPAPEETVEEPPRPVPEPVQPTLAIRNACFASRVRAWGVVDRFEPAEFQPGQELIVYFELDHLASRQSAEGHTTRIDTVLRLVGGDGARVHEWTFEPLEETCGSQRRDYFARYLVTLPASVSAGSCRVEVAVTDTIAGRTAQASLPMDVVAR